MRVAVLQSRPVLGDVAANLARIAAAVEGRAADLWVLPELATTGYLLVDRAGCARVAETVPGPTTEALARLCAARRCHMVAGLAERAGDRLYNAAVLVGPDGLVGAYRKTHLFDREHEIFDPGPGPFRSLPLGEGRIGLMICFDWLFPEAARSLALDGAELLAHPSNIVLPFAQAAMVTRAIENGVFVALANRVGTESAGGRTLTFTGRSRIIDPRGRVLAEGGPAEEAVIEAEVSLADARDKRITPHNDCLADRRPDCYRLGGEG